ncbi:PREDICTED: uncharacterized protein LOC106118310 [Papilio xuthus]|uniref:Uncharacterized protein LOC106118310 n=1 Tax=Papilio xuthus TaxID=66420 RepID=A0AAJ6ZAE6_PAPXU|nr:PREDICTED: uncharacterized protein LOC106118310 [Papilio xuthus]
MSRAGARHPGAEDSVPSSSTDTMDRPEQLYATLNEYLQLEHKFQPRLCLPDESESGEVTIGARDGAAHVLRCLKVWFDLPADVLVSAINLFDRYAYPALAQGLAALGEIFGVGGNLPKKG